jgi:hypothetical protein
LEFVELAYKRLREDLNTRDYIAWAGQLLDEGADAASIAELASCSWEAAPDAGQVERMFLASIVELGLELPAALHEALLAYASAICQSMILGKMEPGDCVAEMLALADDNQEPYIMWIWIDLLRDFPANHKHYPASFRFNSILDLENADDCIHKTALQFISLCSISLPNKFPWVWCCQHCAAVSDADTFTEASVCTCGKCDAQSAMKNMRFFDNREAYLRDRGFY